VDLILQEGGGGATLDTLLNGGQEVLGLSLERRGASIRSWNQDQNDLRDGREKIRNRRGGLTVSERVCQIS